ncbi:hypothetical protein BD779DRAFT_1469640 [Infundibulicybe gibba]|nr:hypothetical protein BD779DRAFT_1469640 [Infundibulicybe gibba]
MTRASAGVPGWRLAGIHIPSSLDVQHSAADASIPLLVMPIPEVATLYKLEYFWNSMWDGIQDLSREPSLGSEMEEKKRCSARDLQATLKFDLVDAEPSREPVPCAYSLKFYPRPGCCSTFNKRRQFRYATFPGVDWETQSGFRTASFTELPVSGTLPVPVSVAPIRHCGHKPRRGFVCSQDLDSISVNDSPKFIVESAIPTTADLPKAYQTSYQLQLPNLAGQSETGREYTELVDSLLFWGRYRLSRAKWPLRSDLNKANSGLRAIQSGASSEHNPNNVRGIRARETHSWWDIHFILTKQLGGSASCSSLVLNWLAPCIVVPTQTRTRAEKV